MARVLVAAAAAAQGAEAAGQQELGVLALEQSEARRAWGARVARLEAELALASEAQRALGSEERGPWHPEANHSVSGRPQVRPGQQAWAGLVLAAPLLARLTPARLAE